MQQFEAKPEYVGAWKCRVRDWSAKSGETKAGQPANDSVCVVLQLEACGWWDTAGKKWDEYGSGFGLYGNFYVVTKAGEMNVAAINNLVKAGVWTTGFERFDAPPPDDLCVVVETKLDTYNGKTTLKCDWIYPESYVPGERGIMNKADSEKLKSLDARFGARIRAAVAATPDADRF